MWVNIPLQSHQKAINKSQKLSSSTVTFLVFPIETSKVQMEFLIHIAIIKLSTHPKKKKEK